MRTTFKNVSIYMDHLNVSSYIMKYDIVPSGSITHSNTSLMTTWLDTKTVFALDTAHGDVIVDAAPESLLD